MATTSGLKICPDCMGELPLPIPEFCPHCSTDTAFRNEKRRQLADKQRAHRWKVTTLFEQWRQEDADLEKKPKNEETEKSFPVDQLLLRKELADQYKCLSYAQKFGVLQDAFNILKCSLHSGLSSEEIYNLLQIGTQIGEVSKAGKDFVKCCGIVEK